MESIEFLPVEVTENFMGLTVGDILRVNPKTGNYELLTESEDIGDTAYSHEKYEISLQPWIIEKYSDHFQVYDDQVKLQEKPEEVLKAEYPMTPEEAYEPSPVFDATPEQIAELKNELAELKEMFKSIEDVLKK